MSQSSTRASSAATDWMDLDNERSCLVLPDAPRVRPDRSAHLMKLRKEQVEHQLATLKVSNREPRVALYARSVNGQPPVQSLSAARDYVARMGWPVSRAQVFTDCRDLYVREDRRGWEGIRQAIKSGFLDGVVALTRSDISPDLVEYESELNWIAGHSGFIALVHAETEMP
ncbi:hypothetical protein [Streptomyces sp. NPDC002526]